MALRITIQGSELLLSPGSRLQIQETNPFLQTDDQLQGDFSYPLTVPVKGNEKALNYGHMLQMRGKSTPIANVVVSDDVEFLSGVLKLDKININLNGNTQDNVNLYFLKGISSFYQDVLNKTLQNVDYGPDRVFQFDHDNHIDDTGLYKHLNDVMKHGTIDRFDYALYPIYHANFVNLTTNDSIKIFNFCVPGNPDPRNPILGSDIHISVFPYLNYLLKRIFESFGWTVDGFNFTDADFKKVNLINVQEIHPAFSVLGNDVPNQYSFNLNRIVPPMDITSFLIAVKNRFGWWYDFDVIKRSCTIRKVRDVFTGDKRIDITARCNTALSLTIAANPKIYALAGDSEAPDKSQWNYQGAFATYGQLPAPSAAFSGQVYFVAAQNKYFICSSDVTGTFTWDILQENDFGITPTGNTDTISTSCLIPVMSIKDFFFQGDMLIPEVSLDDANTTTDSFYLAFAQGLAQTQNTNVFYPYGSPHPFDLRGNKLTSFSMSYEWPEPVTQADLGVYPVFWKSFLDKISQEETMEIIVRLTPQQVVAFSWDTTYIIDHTEYIVSQRNRNMAYDGSVVLTMVRI